MPAKRNVNVHGLRITELWVERRAWRLALIQLVGDDRKLIVP